LVALVGRHLLECFVSLSILQRAVSPHPHPHPHPSTSTYAHTSTHAYTCTHTSTRYCIKHRNAVFHGCAQVHLASSLRVRAVFLYRRRVQLCATTRHTRNRARRPKGAIPPHPPLTYRACPLPTPSPGSICLPSTISPLLSAVCFPSAHLLVCA
jgi:hypothetical protein